MYQCGYEGCHAVVSRKGQHLRRFHKITKKEELKEATALFTTLAREKMSKRPTLTKKSKTRSKIPKQSPSATVQVVQKKRKSSAVHSPPPAKRRKALIIESEEDEEEAGNNTESDEGSEETYHSDVESKDEDSELAMDEAHSDIITEMQQMAPLAEEDNDELKPSSSWNEHYIQGEPKKRQRSFHVEILSLLAARGGRRSLQGTSPDSRAASAHCFGSDRTEWRRHRMSNAAQVYGHLGHFRRTPPARQNPLRKHYEVLYKKP